MKTKVLILSIGFLLSLVFGWFIIGLLLAAGTHRYLYGYELETYKFTDFIGIVAIGVLVISLIVGMTIGYVAGTHKKK